MFDKFDTDGSGGLDEREFVHACALMGLSFPQMDLVHILCVAACCSVLQRVAECCSVLQRWYLEVSACVCVCVCERESEREREKEGERETF